MWVSEQIDSFLKGVKELASPKNIIVHSLDYDSVSACERAKADRHRPKERESNTGFLNKTPQFI